MKVTCVLSTLRAGFVEHALDMFHTQEWPDKELILVEAASAPYSGSLPPQARKVRAPGGLGWGRRINLGIAEASGEIVHRLDDDDYYAPKFLERAVKELEKHPLCYWDRFAVYFAQRGEMRTVQGAFVCGSTVFRKADLAQNPYPDVNRAIDYRMIEAARNAGIQASRVTDAAALFVYARHGADNWKTTWAFLGGKTTELAVDDLLHSRSNPAPAYLLPAEQADYYRGIAR